MNQASSASDTDWTIVYWCVGSLLAGVVIGAFVAAPLLQKMKDKNKGKKTETPAKP